MSARRLATLLAFAFAAAGCREARARDAELLPGRTRPLFEHTWSHPRDLRFAENGFTPASPTDALLTTSSGLRAYVIPAKDGVVQITAAIPLGPGLERANEVGAASALSRLLSQQIDERLPAGFIGRVQVDQELDLTRVSLQLLADDWRSALSAVIATLRQPRLSRSRTAGAPRPGAAAGRGAGGRGGGGGAARPVAELTRMLATYPLAPPLNGGGAPADAIEAMAWRSLGPRSIVIGIAGRVSPSDARRELESLTAGWQSSPAAASPVTPATDVFRETTDRMRTIDEPGYTTWLAVGHPVPPINPQDEAAVAVMADVLNIRLTIAVREIRGLANSTQFVMPATTRQPGLMHVRSGARPESVAPIILYIKEDLSRIREATGAPTAEELEQVKGGLVLGRWQGLLDSAGEAAAAYAAEAARFGTLDRLMRWPAAVRAVTAQQVTAAAQKYIQPARLGTVVIGQLDDVRRARHPRWPAVFEDVMRTTAARD